MLFEGYEAWRFLDKKYGLCHRVYSPPTDVWVLLSHCCVEHSGGKQQDSLSLPPSLRLLTWVSPHTDTQSSVTSHSLPSTIHTHTQSPTEGWEKEANKVLLNGGLFRKDGEHLKSRPFQSRAWGMELDHKRNGFLSLSSKGMVHNRNVIVNVICSSLHELFIYPVLYLPTLLCVLLWLRYLASPEQLYQW